MDKTDNLILGIVLGGIVGILPSMYFGVKPLGEKLNEYNSLLRECEKNLPRNVQCELKAVSKTPR